MRWLVLALLLAPVAHAASVGEQATYATSAGSVTYRWDRAISLPGPDGGAAVAWVLAAPDSEWWLLPRSAMFATATAGDYDPEDHPVLPVAQDPPGTIVRRHIDFTATAPCAGLVEAAWTQLLAACTVAGRRVPAGTPITNVPWGGGLQVEWDAAGFPTRLVFDGAWERRVAWDPGSDALPPRASAAAQWATAPPGPWGPVEDEAHEMSRRAAYEEALADVRLAQARQWTQERTPWPQAGSAFVLDDGTAPMHAWTFTLTDGEDSLAFSLRRHAGLATEAYFLDAPAAAPLDDIPGQWPTVAALQERLRHHADWDVQPTWWGYRIDAEHGLVFEVVHDTSQVTDGRWIHREARLVVTADGRTLSYEDLGPGREAALSYPSAGALASRTLQDLDPEWQPGFLLAGIGLAAGLRWLWLLFTRIQGRRLLEHPRRRCLHDAIEAQPGIHLSELARACKMPNGPLMHHLRKLEKAGLVRAHRAPGLTSYTLAGSGWHRFLPLVQATTARRVVEEMAAGPRTIAQLDGVLPVSASAIRWHLDRMVQAHLVERRRDGNRFRYALAPEAVPLAAHLQGRNDGSS